MTTLYASDLDGTLLAPGAVLSDYSRNAIARLCDRGVRFTVATARTTATVTGIMRGVPLKLPGILMNGTVLYSFSDNTYLQAERIERTALERAVEISDKYTLPTMFYGLEGAALHVRWRDDCSACMREFVRTRSGTSYKRFSSVEDYSGIADKSIIYIGVLGTEKQLAPAYEEYKKVSSLNTVMYREVDLKGIYVLESFSACASKAAAVRKVAELCGADRIVAFGDNANDLPLFEAADLKLAVSNAIDEVKLAADEVIGANTEDGVAKWLMAHA